MAWLAVLGVVPTSSAIRAVLIPTWCISTINSAWLLERRLSRRTARRLSSSIGPSFESAMERWSVAVGSDDIRLQQWATAPWVLLPPGGTLFGSRSLRAPASGRLGWTYNDRSLKRAVKLEPGAAGRPSRIGLSSR